MKTRPVPEGFKDKGLPVEYLHLLVALYSCGHASCRARGIVRSLLVIPDICVLLRCCIRTGVTQQQWRSQQADWHIWKLFRIEPTSVIPIPGQLLKARQHVYCGARPRSRLQTKIVGQHKRTKPRVRNGGEHEQTRVRRHSLPPDKLAAPHNRATKTESPRCQCPIDADYHGARAMLLWDIVTTV